METKQTKIKQVNINLGKRINVQKEFTEQTRLRKSFERKLRAQMLRWFKELYTEVADLYELGQSYNEVLRNKQNELSRIFNSHYRAVIIKFGERQLRNLEKQNRFEEIYQDYIAQVGATRVVGVTAATRSIIRRVIDNNIDEGVAVVGKEIRRQAQPFNRMTRYRANTIARTETHNAASFSNHKTAESMNIPAMQKRWATTLDERSRQDHVLANGQTVPMDEDFTVGGTSMAYPGDQRGGAKNVINCRCVVLYVVPEDEVSDTGLVTPTKPRATESTDISLDKLLSSPRDASFTHETFKIGKKAVMLRSLDDRAKLSKREYEEFFEEPEFNKVYGTRFKGQFKGRKLYENQWSRTQTINKKKTKLELSEEALSIVEQSMKEVDELAKRFKIPKINGILIGYKDRAVASMGDGVLFLNARSFNKYAKDTAKVSPNKLTQKERQEFIIKQQQLDEIDKKFDKLYEKRPKKIRSDEYIRWYSEYVILKKERDEFLASFKNLKDKRGYVKKPVSTYKLGQKKGMPYGVDEYYDNGLDQARSVIYHEFGHHVHQTIGLNKAFSKDKEFGGYRTFANQNAVPIEQELITKIFSKKNVMPSKYANTNSKEYFAENFANYFMGKKELVSPDIKELIERIMREQNGIN